jgi:hypothetical protein
MRGLDNGASCVVHARCIRENWRRFSERDNESRNAPCAARSDFFSLRTEYVTTNNDESFDTVTSTATARGHHGLLQQQARGGTCPARDRDAAPRPRGGAVAVSTRDFGLYLRPNVRFRCAPD